MQRVTAESAGVQRLLTDCLLPPLIDAVVLIVAIGYLLAISWQMTVAALALTPLALISLRFAGRDVQAAMRRVMNADRAMAAELEQTVSGISEIQTFNAQSLRSRRFHEVSEHAAKSDASIVVWMQATANGSQVFIALSTVVVLVVGIGFSASFGLTFAGLMVFTGMVPTMFGAAQRVMGAYTTYQSVAPNVASTYELLDTRPSVQDRADAVHTRRRARQSRVRGRGLRLHAGAECSRRAVVLDQPRARRWPWSVASGRASRRCSTSCCASSIRSGAEFCSMATISRESPWPRCATRCPSLPSSRSSSRTRSARTSGWRGQDASDADIEQACEDAHVHSVITDPSKLHDGYDTVVDVQVPSGGQKRLIALARCLLRKPEVLLLDEPTENLDADQRARLTGVIRGYARDRTCIVISHDMDFIAAVADRILVLEHGRIAQVGDHHALMAEGGLYKRLYEAQNVDPDLVYPTPSDVEVG